VPSIIPVMSKLKALNETKKVPRGDPANREGTSGENAGFSWINDPIPCVPGALILELTRTGWRRRRQGPKEKNGTLGRREVETWYRVKRFFWTEMADQMAL